jgi:diguanylate cyclase (GGDEF)-like protein
MHQERAYRKLHTLATVDSLTGVLTRHALESHAARVLAESKRHGRSLCLLLIDLDHFKDVNDTYGHAAGDVVLKTTAHRVQSLLRMEDALGRLGGEEFLVVLPNTSGNRAWAVAERIRQHIRERPVGYRDWQIDITASIGVAEGLFGETDLDALLKRADIAMYAAKRAGRDRVAAASASGPVPM